MNLKCNVKRKLKRVEKAFDTEISYIEQCIERTKGKKHIRYFETLHGAGLDVDGDVLYKDIYNKVVSYTTVRLKELCDEEDIKSKEYLNLQLHDLKAKKRIVKTLYEDMSDFYYRDICVLINTKLFNRYIICRMDEIRNDIFIKREILHIEHLRHTCDEIDVLKFDIYSLLNELELYTTIAHEFNIPAPLCCNINYVSNI